METPNVMSKVYNLTDVSTPTLVQYGLVGQTIAVGTRMVAPGEYAEATNNNAQLLVLLEHLLTVGAVSVDMLPPPYVKARAALAAAAGSKLSPSPAHLTLPETKVTDPGPQKPPPPVIEAPTAEAPPATEEPKVNSKRGK